MSTKFKTVITTAGAAKLAAATVPGGKKVTLSAMAVGDGNGKLPVPDAGQTKLVHEVWRHALNKVSVDNKNKNYIVAELVVPPEVGGFWMRELGLYDDAGTLIAVSNMAESYKPELAEGSGRAQTCRMVIILSNVASVELSIDASTVMATQDYVDDKIAEHEQSRRHPDATLTEKGFTQLSSATNSTSEKLAATPKAVKAAYDNAEKRMQKDQNGGDIPDKGAFLDNVGVTSLTFMKNNGEMPLDADLNTFGPVKDYVGVWYKSTSSNATLEKHFPEDGAVGVLEVFNGGNFAGMQRYTTRTGNVYMRNLSGSWNGSDGPWSYWRQIQSATRPLSTTIDLNTLGGAEHLGLWRNSSGSIASFDRNYPEEGSYGQGLLEVLEGGGYSRTQRYTTRRGNVYVRCLSATWNAENPQWEPWSRVGHQSECRYYEGDLNDLTSPGIYSVTGKASNGPMLDTAGATLLGILEVIRRFDGVSVWQRYTTTGKSDTTQGRTFERVYAGSKWTEWREVYNSFSLPLNLGIGGAVAKLSSLDWQTYDFVPGSLITVRLDNMTNIPDGMDWGVIDGNLINIAVGPSDDSGTGRSMHVWRSTVSKANYRFFMVRVSGNPGNRTITTRRVPIIDEAQTWGAKQTFSAGLSGELSGNAETATKLKTARKINSVSFDGTSDINLTPEDIGALPITGGTLTGGLTAAGEIISKSANGLRIAYGNYGFFIRNDGSSTYLMLTNSGDSLGTWNSLRPLTINNASGAVSIGNSLTVNGDIGTNAWVYANRFATNSSTGTWINMRDQNVIFGRNAVSTDGAQALLRQDHADRKFMIGGLGNKQFGIYMINNSRTANGTDGQAYMDNNGNWLCGAQVILGNYGNFDSRYVRDVRLGTRVVQTMQKGVMYEKSGHVITGLGIVGEVDGDDPAVFRPVQKYINGTWYNVSQV
ncbi:phage tail-collar fiber domain-containing protein [Escherichia marmotae]|nr:phage tail protein [Escherichia marmotae]MDQ9271489.1 phage tail protein [Escherichia marmotae]